MKKVYNQNIQMVRWLLICIIFSANINLIWATDKSFVNTLLELEQKIKTTAEEKRDYVFTEVYNSKPIFTLPDIPIFQLVPQLKCEPKDAASSHSTMQSDKKSTTKGTKNNAHSIDLYFHFQVKELHIVTTDEESNLNVKRSYVAKDRTTFKEKSFHDVSVKIQGWCGSFYSSQVNDISTGFWDENAKPGSLSLKQTNLEMTFDTKYNRVIFTTLKNKRFIIFDLTENGDKIQLTLRGLFQNTVIFKVAPLFTDKNRNIFDPPGLEFEKLPIPGELYEQNEKDLILTQNFSPTTILLDNILLITPLTCPAKDNPFELELTFKIKSLQDHGGKSIPIHPNFNTVVATVVCRDTETGWNFDNSPFMLGELVFGIIFDLRHEKIAILNYAKTIDFEISLDTTFKPTLELKNLTEDKFVKIHFSEYQNFSPNSSPTKHHQFEENTTESFSFRSEIETNSNWNTPRDSPSKFWSTSKKMNLLDSSFRSSTKDYRPNLEEIKSIHGSESSSGDEDTQNTKNSKNDLNRSNVTTHSSYYKN